MSELNVYHHDLRPDEYDEFYLKYEADKVISDLEKKHKTEVKELLCLIRDKENNFNRAFDSVEKELRHQKYKRCLAMASYWVAVSYQCVDDKHRKRAEKHHRKWLELAKKFKDKEAK